MACASDLRGDNWSAERSSAQGLRHKCNIRTPGGQRPANLLEARRKCACITLETPDRQSYSPSSTLPTAKAIILYLSLSVSRQPCFLHVVVSYRVAGC